MNCLMWSTKINYSAYARHLQSLLLWIWSRKASQAPWENFSRRTPSWSLLVNKDNYSMLNMQPHPHNWSQARLPRVRVWPARLCIDERSELDCANATCMLDRRIVCGATEWCILLWVRNQNPCSQGSNLVVTCSQLLLTHIYWSATDIEGQDMQSGACPH